MIKGLIFIVVILALGTGFAWLADRPGEMLINWQGQQIELSLMTAVSFIVAIIAAVMFVWWLIRLVLTSPEIMSRYFKTRRKDRGYRALSQGLIAAGAGDAALAKKLTKQSKGLIDGESEPLIHLLDVQTAMIEGRDDDARATLEKMVEIPETSILGLRGLYLEAKKLGATEAAQQYAAKAADKAPHLTWAGDASIEYSALLADWDEAIRRLEKQRTADAISPKDAKRKKAVLLTGRAMARPEGELAEIADDGLQALKLAPDFVPAAIVAAKALFRQNQLRKGSKVLEKIWKTTVHPQVAETYVAARAGDTAGDRLKRAQRLENMRGNHVDSLTVVARTALEAKKLDLARKKAEAAARLGPSENIYLLLADIEEAETGDQSRVGHWLAHAIRATRDPQWTADGIVSETWAAISPVSGKLDVFEWKVPLTMLEGPIAEGEIAEDLKPEEEFEMAKSTLPAIALTPEPEIKDSTETIDVEAEETSVSDEKKPVQEEVEVSETEIIEAEFEEPISDDKDETVLRKAVDDPGIDEDTEDSAKKDGFRLF